MTDVKVGLTLDRSGSMASMWNETVAGVKTFLEDQSKEDGKTWITVTVFDNEIDELFYAWAVEDVPGIETRPRGMTALLDGAAQTIHRTQEWLDDNDWFDGKVLQVIVTDGYENASQEYDTKKFRALVEEKKAQGWEFVFLGANIDAWATGTSYGISGQSVMDYDAQAVPGTYKTLSSATSRWRSADRDSFFDSDEQDQRVNTG